MLEKGLNLAFLYSCGHVLYNPYGSKMVYQKWQKCPFYHPANPGSIVRVMLSKSDKNTINSVIREDMYHCTICGDLFYEHEELAAIGEPKICSESCSKKFSH